jgi:hypothetical protein
MPFDGVNLAPQLVLRDAMEASGLQLLDLDLLEEHKAEQIRINSPGWMYRHRIGLQLAHGIAVIAALAAFLVWCGENMPMSALGIGTITMALLLLPQLLPVRGQPRWEERRDSLLLAVPASMRDAAVELRKHLPDVEFRIGELFQDKVTLDPYLVAEYRGARVLIGIWDGDRIVMRA